MNELFITAQVLIKSQWTNLFFRLKRSFNVIVQTSKKKYSPIHIKVPPPYDQVLTIIQSNSLWQWDITLQSSPFSCFVFPLFPFKTDKCTFTLLNAMTGKSILLRSIHYNDGNLQRSSAQVSIHTWHYFKDSVSLSMISHGKRTCARGKSIQTVSLPELNSYFLLSFTSFTYSKTEKALQKIYRQYTFEYGIKRERDKWSISKHEVLWFLYSNTELR